MKRPSSLIAFSWLVVTAAHAQVGIEACDRLFSVANERETCKSVWAARSRWAEEHLVDATTRRLEREREEAARAQQSLDAARERRAEQEALEVKQRAEAEARDTLVLREKPIGAIVKAWELSGFGNVMVVRVVLQNNLRSAAKDFLVECLTHGNSGTTISKVSRTLYEALGRGERREFELNMGFANPQSATASCAVSRWSVIK